MTAPTAGSTTAVRPATRRARRPPGFRLSSRVVVFMGGGSFLGRRLGASADAYRAVVCQHGQRAWNGTEIPLNGAASRHDRPAHEGWAGRQLPDLSRPVGRWSRRLLQPGADGRDALRVEAEPVHPAHVARVLDLDTAVHDHRHAAVLRDPRGLLV